MENKPKARILVVDDDENTLILVCRILTRLGYEALPAQDAIAALGCLTDNDGLDVVLTDINMPGMDGWELATRVKALKPGMLIVALTGQSPVDILPRLRGSGVSQALFKPLRLEHLRDALERCLESEMPKGGHGRSGECTEDNVLH
jgi:DNA-binding NtrC family response regulator